METDYSPFLQMNDDGSIWWPLLDAVKLGAGYLPLRDDERNLLPDLRATDPRTLVNERNLLSEFGPTHYTDAHPRTAVRDDTRFVEAQEFLLWLSRYLKADADPAFPFPAALARAVQLAQTSRTDAEIDALRVSLTAALEDWFEKPLSDLPVDIQTRVHDEIFLPPWDAMSATQRRTCAMAEDARRDPTHDPERKFWWDMAVRVGEIENTIKEWKDDRQASPDLRLERERQLPALKRELTMLERQTKTDERGWQSFAGNEDDRPVVDDDSVRFVAYPKALHTLAIRLDATADELAAWVYMGPKIGGLAAFVRAKELNPPRRFHYGLGGGSERDFDYVTPLMGCWFREDDLRGFEPVERYIPGKALVERWGNVPGIQAEAFIIAKVRNSELCDLHPITGRTQASQVRHEGYPPLSDGIYLMKDVRLVEAEQFPQTPDLFGPTVGQVSANPADASAALPGEAGVPRPSERPSVRSNASSGVCEVFRAMLALSAEEITISFVGDTAETGLAANNLLEISARGASRRVSLAEFGLVNRTKGVLNAQAAVLVGLTRQLKLSRNDRNQQKMSRLRRLLRQHLGVRDDPFEGFRASIGWLPRFTILDRRGAADERAKQDALRKTTSVEEVLEGRETIESSERVSDDFDDEDDEAGAWLDKQ